MRDRFRECSSEEARDTPRCDDFNFPFYYQPVREVEAPAANGKEETK